MYFSNKALCVIYGSLAMKIVLVGLVTGIVGTIQNPSPMPPVLHIVQRPVMLEKTPTPQVCIKVAELGKPLQLGICSTTADAGGACTCN